MKPEGQWRVCCSMGPLDSKVSPNLPVQLALAACASSSSARQWRMREVLIHAISGM